ncbi:MAG: putative NADH-flavin reductase [Ulvibacter sp.]|jgi:putative NADH-flavin reductase
MKICIFGADGRTGREVVKSAKAKGYEVTPFSYSDGQDVMDYEAVRGAIAGCDAVISTLGHIKGSDPLVQTKGISNIVRAMKELGLRRVLSMTGTGARVVGDKPSLVDRFLNFGVNIVDPDRINDGVEHVKVLQESGVDWTIVRVLKLSKSDAEVKDYKLTDYGPAELLTSRKKVAKVLVDLLDDKNSYGKLPVISG